MTDYQRACEVVGCKEHPNRNTCQGRRTFANAALEWLIEQDCRSVTLTAALTAAVLAVAGETE